MSDPRDRRGIREVSREHRRCRCCCVVGRRAGQTCGRRMRPWLELRHPRYVSFAMCELCGAPRSRHAADHRGLGQHDALRRGIKIPLYALAGIPEVWIVTRTAGHEYGVQERFGRDAVLRTVLVPVVSVAVASILG
jgi:hypothetical protein